MAKHHYAVQAVCTATVTEQWRVTSDRPLVWDEMTEIIAGVEATGDGIDMTFVSEQASDERDRELTAYDELPEAAAAAGEPPVASADSSCWYLVTARHAGDDEDTAYTVQATDATDAHAQVFEQLRELSEERGDVDVEIYILCVVRCGATKPIIERNE